MEEPEEPTRHPAATQKPSHWQRLGQKATRCQRPLKNPSAAAASLTRRRRPRLLTRRPYPRSCVLHRAGCITCSPLGQSAQTLRLRPGEPSFDLWPWSRGPRMRSPLPACFGSTARLSPWLPLWWRCLLSSFLSPLLGTTAADPFRIPFGLLPPPTLATARMRPGPGTFIGVRYDCPPPTLVMTQT